MRRRVAGACRRPTRRAAASASARVPNAIAYTVSSVRSSRPSGERSNDECSITPSPTRGCATCNTAAAGPCNRIARWRTTFHMTLPGGKTRAVRAAAREAEGVNESAARCMEELYWLVPSPYWERVRVRGCRLESE